MRNLEWLKYTYLHRRAFEYCVKKRVAEPSLREEMLRRAEVHDMDKMLMYLFLDQKEAQALHVQTQPHHLENRLPRTREDLVETVIDYECAPYTKPDKPLNAYAFTNLLMDMKVLDLTTGAQLIDIMRDLGIANSTSVSDDVAGSEYISGLGEITEEMILEEILSYVNDHHENALKQVLQRFHINDSARTAQ